MVDNVTQSNLDVTNLPTELDGVNLTNVSLYTSEDGTFTFDIDSDNRIDAITIKGNTYERAGNNGNEFVNKADDTDVYTYSSFGGDNHLQYSDFGILASKGGLSDTKLFAGGYNSKEITSQADIVNDLFGGSDPVFTGSAVAKISKQDNPNDGIIVRTNSAELRFSAGKQDYNLEMPFHTNPVDSPDYYDVTFYGTADGNSKDLIFAPGYTGDWQWQGDPDKNVTVKSTSAGQHLYGEGGVTQEITGYVRGQEKISAGDVVNFEAAYGVKR